MWGVSVVTSVVVSRTPVPTLPWSLEVTISERYNSVVSKSVMSMVTSPFEWRRAPIRARSAGATSCCCV